MRYAVSMFPRDEAWERVAAVDHAESLIDLLRKGQDLDADVHDKGCTLREALAALAAEIASTTDADANP